jgi:tetrahydromethanopterin S-methyltransferase subunit D
VFDPGVVVPVNVVQVLLGIGFEFINVVKGPPPALACTFTVILLGVAQLPVGVGFTSRDIPTGFPTK